MDCKCVAYGHHQPSFDPSKAHLVVAQDGTGNCKTISEALTASQKMRTDDSSRFVIYVKTGTYPEYVVVEESMKNITIVGQGIDSTVVTGNRNWKDNRLGPSASATFTVKGDGFLAQEMTFENTAGPEKFQAVAFRSISKHSVCSHCSFKGYQDTLYVDSGLQFYRECDIYGTIDFIFGDATAVLQECNIYVRKPLDGQTPSITAQSRKKPNDPTGISIHNCYIKTAPEFVPVPPSLKIYLGRPWADYSRVVVMKTCIDSPIDPARWTDWDGETKYRRNTVYHGEYNNCGIGADTKGRVKWPGYHGQLTEKDAMAFTVENLLSGASSWIPKTVPYIPDL